MCVNGVNTNQLKSTIEQIDEEVALTRRWTHRLHELADSGKQERTAAALMQVQTLLDEVRGALVDCQDAVDLDDADDGVRIALL